MRQSSCVNYIHPGSTQTAKAIPYLEVDGDLASKAAVSMLLGNGATKPAKSGSVSVDNVKLSVHLALILDGILDLGVCQDLII